MSKARNHRISVTSGGSGFFAVHLADYEDMNWMPDVVSTGIGRYKSYAEAAEEAKEWAEADELPLELRS